MRKIIPVPVPAGHRYCFGCRAVLPLTDFGRCRRSKEGRTMRCRKCLAEYRRTRREIVAILEDAAERIEAAYHRPSSFDWDAWEAERRDRYRRLARR